jgi:serine/threonine protein kinase
MGELIKLKAASFGNLPRSGVRITPPGGWSGVVLKGTYEIIRKVAHGGMGAVYEAKHRRLGHRVAVKLLRAECAGDPELLARFRNEAEIVAQLGHPHIVTVFDVDETEDHEPFLVMEFLEGETLAERMVRKKTLELAEAGRIALQIASALACTHERGVVHRDLKPENVMLLRAHGEHDFVKVLDFGISKSGHARLTQTHVLLGTPEYMAPEQVRRPDGVDHRVDQYALAVILYEALTGSLPHEGGSPAEIVLNLMARAPRPLRDLAPAVPTAVAEVVMRALRTDPDTRFRDISQFAWALDNALTKAKRTRSKTVPRTDATFARELLSSAQSAYARGHLDEAVSRAEALIELAAYRGDPAVYAVIARAVNGLDRIFEARVGPPDRRLERTPNAVNGHTLSEKAAQLLALADQRTVAEAIGRSGFPRRDAIRMLAGLLRRELLAASDP